MDTLDDAIARIRELEDLVEMQQLDWAVEREALMQRCENLQRGDDGGNDNVEQRCRELEEQVKALRVVLFLQNVHVDVAPDLAKKKQVIRLAGTEKLLDLKEQVGELERSNLMLRAQAVALQRTFAETLTWFSESMQRLMREFGVASRRL